MWKSDLWLGEKENGEREFDGGGGNGKGLGGMLLLLMMMMMMMMYRWRHGGVIPISGDARFCQESVLVLSSVGNVEKATRIEIGRGRSTYLGNCNFLVTSVLYSALLSTQPYRA